MVSPNQEMYAHAFQNELKFVHFNESRLKTYRLNGGDNREGEILCKGRGKQHREK